MTMMQDMERNERDEMAYALPSRTEPGRIALGVDDGPNGQEVSLTIEQATYLLIQLGQAVAEVLAAG